MLRCFASCAWLRSRFAHLHQEPRQLLYGSSEGGSEDRDLSVDGHGVINIGAKDGAASIGVTNKSGDHGNIMQSYTTDEGETLIINGVRHKNSDEEFFFLPGTIIGANGDYKLVFEDDALTTIGKALTIGALTKGALNCYLNN